MARLALARVSKRFGALAAVDAVDLDVADGEFLAVLGPSGCGKTTLLRLVAGFEAPDAGTIALGPRRVAGPDVYVAPEERRVGIVFQTYALWPHMSVARNVGYPLEVAGVKGAAYETRVAAALAAVGLAGLEERRPAQLSGGQRQRVALARCLVMSPDVVLLDEPLANLDAHLRAAMMDEFAAFHAKTGATMIYITHDQGEAMALAHRIAVMDRGRLVQVAAPRELYREPASAMVGSFIGRGAVVPARVRAANGSGVADVELFGQVARLRCRPGQLAGEALACLRPEDLELAPPDAAGAFAARVVRTAYRGRWREVEISPDGAAEILLRLDVGDEVAPSAGAAVALRVAGGWVIPSA